MNEDIKRLCEAAECAIRSADGGSHPNRPAYEGMASAAVRAVLTEVKAVVIDHCNEMGSIHHHQVASHTILAMNRLLRED